MICQEQVEEEVKLSLVEGSNMQTWQKRKNEKGTYWMNGPVPGKR